MTNLRPTFGQSYKKANGYNDEKFLLLSGSTLNSLPSNVTRKLITTAAIMEDFNDVPNLCKALKITEMQLIEMQMNGVKNVQDILNFTGEYVKGKTMILNIYVITHEVDVDHSRDIGSAVRKISKVFLGHHVLVCIPIENSLKEFDLKTIENLTAMPADIHQLFQNEANALVDYKKVEKKSVTQIIKDSQNYPSDGIVSLFVKLDQSCLPLKCLFSTAVTVAVVGILGYVLYKKFYESK